MTNELLSVLTEKDDEGGLHMRCFVNRFVEGELMKEKKMTKQMNERNERMK